MIHDWFTFKVAEPMETFQCKIINRVPLPEYKVALHGQVKLHIHTY